MNQLGHGANVEDMCREYNKDSKSIIDFSSNINPYLIKDLDKYLIEGLRECSKYPDIEYTRLKENISEYIGVDSRYIIPGNGATEIIYLLMKSIGGRLAILNPTFSEYERSAKINNLEVVNLYLSKENDFEINIDYIKDNIDKFDSLFICNPSNPIGKVYKINELLGLIKKHNKLLIIDETFMEFVGDEDEFTLTKHIHESSNIFIIKAITKFFGMPGIRLGYGVSSNIDIMRKMYELKEPWTINTFADTISNYIFKESEYIESSKLYFVAERKFMIEELGNIKYIKVYQTDTNFILIKLLNKEAKELKHKLFINDDILIRDASNFRSLDNSYIRIAIKSHEENIKIIKAIKSILGV
ncbi:MAG: pyridoxal phosphate-dependent aminotransferase [Paraclostridium sp.]